MFHLSHVLYAFAGFYAVVAGVIVHRLRKPTCRICVFRQACPHRLQNGADPLSKRCYEDDANDRS